MNLIKSPTNPVMRSRTVSLLLMGIVFLGFILRFLGLHFGLPFMYHTDEPIVVNHAMAFGSGDLNPHFFRIPPFVSYGLFGLYGLLFLAGLIVGFFPTLNSFELFFYRDPGFFYYWARLIFGCVAGTLTLGFYARILRKFFSDSHALLGTLFFAVCYLHVRDSHYIYCDIPLLMVLVLGWGTIWAVSFKPDSIRGHLAMGFWIGLATAVKYNGISLGLPYVVYSFLTLPKKKIFTHFFLAAAIAVIVFFAANPWVLLDRQFFIQELIMEATARQGGTPWYLHLFITLPRAFGLPASILALGGFLGAFFSRDAKRLSLAIYIAGYYLLLMKAGQAYSRYILPLLPGLIFFASDAVLWLIARFRHGFLKKITAVVLGSLLIVPSLVASILLIRLTFLPDTRTLCREWINQNLPVGSSIVLDGDFLTPRLNFSKDQLLEKKETILKTAGQFSQARLKKLDYLIQNADSTPGFRLYFLMEDTANPEKKALFAKPVLPFSLKAVRNQSIRYAVIVKFNRQTDGSDFRRLLSREAKKIAQFSPYHDPSVEWSFDWQDPTALPGNWKELATRKAMGPILAIYELSSPSQESPS